MVLTYVSAFAIDCKFLFIAQEYWLQFVSVIFVKLSIYLVIKLCMVITIT